MWFIKGFDVDPLNMHWRECDMALAAVHDNDVLCLCVLWTYFKTAVRPRAEFHEACLGIEGEVADVNLAVGFEYGGRIPGRRQRETQDQ